MRIFCKIGLRYETSRDQLERVLMQVSTMLREHPRVETTTAWIRLAKLADSALELEMQAYVLTREFDDFAAVRESLLLRVMDIVESCGTSLAFPSQTVYIAREQEQPAVDSARSGR
jgi:MscS family membrane protein